MVDLYADTTAVAHWCTGCGVFHPVVFSCPLDGLDNFVFPDYNREYPQLPREKIARTQVYWEEHYGKDQ